MEDCVQVEPTAPIRQGDVLKHLSSDGTTGLAVVVTADCDIANSKFGDAGLVCIELSPLADYILLEHAKVAANRQLKRRFREATEWINKRWLASDPLHNPLSEESVKDWIMRSSPEEIETELGLPLDDRKSFVKRETPALQSAQTLVDTPKDRYSYLDALRATQAKPTSRSEQLNTLFGSLEPKDLPLDMFFVSSVPGEPGVGFIAKLRALSFVPIDRSFTSMVAAKESENSFVRIGRLEPTFRHALAQQFGMLFARIGMPKQYEADRELAFKLVSEQIKMEMGEDQ